MATSIIVPGMFNIWVALPGAYATANLLGVNTDDLEIPLEVIKSPVHGDRNGGRAGDPIEEQYLGEKARVTLELSEWDKTIAATLRTNGGITATAGTIPQSAIGALMRKTASYRFIFIPVRDVTRGINFPCSLIARNHLIGGGTKYEALKLELEFHRAPIGHTGGKDNILYDSDLTTEEE